MFKAHLFQEQAAFLRRPRRDWADHLDRARGWFGEALAESPAGRPVLVLGAGWGLEVPWSLAPKGTVGWDADPLSRVGTFLRHGRWAPWRFGDFTGALGPLEDLIRRTVHQPWDGRRREASGALTRLALLLPGLPLAPSPLEAWIREHRPGLILSANVAGQLAPVARALVSRAFQPMNPFPEDPEAPDPLGEALEGFAARLVRDHFRVLAESGAELCVLYDRAVAFEGDLACDPGWTEDWRDQIRATGSLELSDPLCGVDPSAELSGLAPKAAARWVWPLGPGQVHLMEARRLEPQN